MNKAFFLQLVFNASLLLTLALIYDLIAVRWRIGRASLRQVPVGVIIGTMGVLVMLASWKLEPGIVFDTRSILLGVAGLFFGTVPTVVAMAITAAYRGFMGGAAVWMGIAVIFTSGAIGITWRHMRRSFLADITWRELYLFGFVIHLDMLGCALFLPRTILWHVLANISLPVLLIYPIVTAMLGKLLADHLKRERTKQLLRESEGRYQNLAKIAPVGIFHTDENGATTYVNPMWCRISGLSEAKAMGAGWLDAVNPDDRESLSKGWQETINLQKPSFADYRFLRPDGTIAWVMGQASPEMNSENEIVGYVGTITDISERKRAEEEIKMLATALKRINECVSITDVENTILFVNEAFLKTYGYSEQELIGQNIKIVRPPNSSQKVFEEVLPGTLSGGWTGELVNRRKDGSEFPIFLSTTIIEKKDGKPNCLIGIAIDITERKRAEDALRESEENFRHSLDGSPLGVRVATVKDKTIYANKVLLDIYGYANVEELNKISLKERYTPQSYAEFHMRKKDRERGDFGLSEYEINIVRKNGEIRHLLVLRKEVLWNGTKQFQVIYQDITERKQAESQREDALAALRESEEKFRKIFEDHAAVKLLIEPESGAIIDANKAAERYYGWTRAELKRMYIHQINILPAEQVKIEMEKVQQQKRVHFEFRHRRADGSIRDVEVFSSKIEMAGKDILHSIIHDITERKNADDKIRNSLVEKEVLLKEVHHRVKNNLMTIIGLIKMQGTKADNEMFNPLLQELEGRVRAMALVHESLHKAEDLAHVNLQNYIETLSAHIRAQFGAERDIRFRVQAAGVDVNPDIAVPCGLILNELITNAYKHAFPKDKPRAGEGNCEINVIVNQESGILTLTVADNGVGLPAGKNWKNPETLGLRLVKMLSQQLNGSMELDRSAGTTFSLRFAHSSGGK